MSDHVDQKEDEQGLHNLPEELLSYEKTPQERLADEAVKTAVRLVEIGAQDRQARFKEIQKSEAMYEGENKPALRGRSNIPFDSILVKGFVDTHLAKVDEPISLDFKRRREQDKKAAEKITAVKDIEAGPDRGAWNIKDIAIKKLAIFSGRGIASKFSENINGKFVDHFEPIDHWNFITEPKGGGWLDKHLFKAELNIFKTNAELRAKATRGVYHKRQVERLIAATNDEGFKKNEDLYRYNLSRQSSTGTDFEVNQFVGSNQNRMTQMVMYFRNDWYYLLFNYDTGVWVRFEPLTDVFTVAKKIPGRGPWITWATNFEAFKFWSPAPIDPVRPIGYSMKKLVNHTMDNLEKRNWDMTAYDPRVFTKPRQLLYRQDGLVKATLRKGQSIENHIYKFKTQDTGGITINLINFLNNFLGEKTGITAATQGQSKEERVGIHFSNLEQVSDRLNLQNKMYEQFHVDLGVNFLWGLYDWMPEKYVVKLIGNKGIEWEEELRRDEVNREFSISVTGGNTEARTNEVLAVKKRDSLLIIKGDPTLRNRINPSWYLKQQLSLGGFEQEEISIALDTRSDYDADILAEAARAIEEIVSGKNPEINRGATTAFITKIIDYAWDMTLEKSIFERLLKYAQQHIGFARQNMIRQGRLIAAQQSEELLEEGAPEERVPTAPEETPVI